MSFFFVGLMVKLAIDRDNKPTYVDGVVKS